jgi:hypothetical protein
MSVTPAGAVALGEVGRGTGAGSGVDTGGGAAEPAGIGNGRGFAAPLDAQADVRAARSRRAIAASSLRFFIGSLEAIGLNSNNR